MKKEAPKLMTIEDLAIITQQGLIGFEQRIMKEISVIKGDVSSLREDVSSLKEEQKETNRRLTSIERKQLGTILTLDETVHRNEFNKIVRRVEVLEKQ